MKKNFKVYILITLLVSIESIFTKSKINNKNISQKSPSRVPEPIKKNEKQNQEEKKIIAEELLFEWKTQFDLESQSPIIKEELETKKYVNKHKDEIFKILFLLVLINKLNDKNILVSNTKDSKKLLDFEKQIELNTKLLIEKFENSEKNKKLEDFKQKDNYLGLEKIIKKMLVDLDLTVSMGKGIINYFSKDPNSLFANLYRKNENIINEVYGKDKKVSNFTEIRNDMIIAIHYNHLFSLEKFLFWAIPFITVTIDKKADSKTKNKAKLERRVFDLICSFFGVKPKIIKVTGLKTISENIKDFLKKYEKEVPIAAGLLVGIGGAIYSSCRSKDFINKDHYGEVEKHKKFNKEYKICLEKKNNNLFGNIIERNQQIKNDNNINHLEESYLEDITKVHDEVGNDNDISYPEESYFGNIKTYNEIYNNNNHHEESYLGKEKPYAWLAED